MQVQLQLPLGDQSVELLPGLISLNSSDSQWNLALDQFRTAKRFCLDIETMRWMHEWAATDKDALVPFRNKVRLIQIGLELSNKMKAIIIDLGGVTDDREEIWASDRVQEFMEVLHKQCSTYQTEVVGHNLYFESSVLYYHYGVKIRKPIDTLIQSRMIYAGATAQFDNIRHDLGSVIYREFKEKPDKSQGADFDWRLPLGNEQLNYAMNDVFYPLRLARKFESYIKGTSWFNPCRVEMACVPVLAECYINGYPTSIKMVDEAIDQYERLKAHVITPFTERFPEVQPTALTKTLIDCFNLVGTEIVYKGSKNEYGESLDFHHYVDKWKDNKYVAAVLNWRTYEKHAQYLRNMRESYIDGACHGYYNTYSPKGTGRTTCGSNIRKGSKAIASTGINLQNPAKPLKGKLGKDIPAEIGIDHLISIRECFRPEDGYKLIIEDLPQAHLMIATKSSNDRVLIDAYNNDVDQHALVGATMAQIAGHDWDWKHIKKNKDDCHLCKGFRHSGKTANYSALNLAGVKRLAAANGISESEAKKIKDAHKATFPQLHDLLKKLVNAANYGWNIKKGDHRIEYLKQVNEDTEYGIARSYDGRELIMKKFDGMYGKSVKAAEATAFHWLATEATIIKGAMCELQHYLDTNPQIDAGLCNLAHDELNFWVREDQAIEFSYHVHKVTTKWMKRYIGEGIKIDGDNETEHLKSIGGSWADK